MKKAIIFHCHNPNLSLAKKVFQVKFDFDLYQDCDLRKYLNILENERYNIDLILFISETGNQSKVSLDKDNIFKFTNRFLKKECLNFEIDDYSKSDFGQNFSFENGDLVREETIWIGSPHIEYKILKDSEVKNVANENLKRKIFKWENSNHANSKFIYYLPVVNGANVCKIDYYHIKTNYVIVERFGTLLGGNWKNSRIFIHNVDLTYDSIDNFQFYSDNKNFILESFKFYYDFTMRKNINFGGGNFVFKDNKMIVENITPCPIEKYGFDVILRVVADLLSKDREEIWLKNTKPCNKIELITNENLDLPVWSKK